MEHELGEHLDGLRAIDLVEAAPDGTLVVDSAGLIRLVNRKVEELFGYARSELLGQPVELLMPSRFREGHAHHRTAYGAAARARPMGSSLDLVGTRKDGSEFPIEISLSPHPTHIGLFVTAAVRDISERKRAERAADIANERLRDAVESISDAFAVFDADRRLLTHNSAYRSLFSAIPGAIIGLRYEQLIEAILDDIEFASDKERELFKKGRVTAFDMQEESVSIRRGGRTYRASSRRTRDGGRVFVVVDRTEDDEREAALRMASAAKSEFLASMSHELRTPLNAVLGFAQLLMRDKKTPLTERHSGMVDQIVRGGEHLLRLIDDVLDLARIEAGKVTVSVEPVDVEELLQQVKTTLDPITTRTGATLHLAPVPPGVGTVLADRTRLGQVLINFGSNAIKYGRQGGNVRFEASLTDGRVRLTVTDDGPGISADKHDRLFQPFQRAGQETGPIEGTGIGLSICKRLAELMNGGVGFQSEPEKGSSFWVELPAARGGSRSRSLGTKASAESSLAGEGPRATVVYVEDNPANIHFMEAVMAEFDRIELVTAPSAEIGLELIRSRDADIAILDINLPGMSGIEALRRLKADPDTVHIPVIVLSAAAMAGEVKAAREAGCYRYLTKPVRVDELTAALEGALST